MYDRAPAACGRMGLGILAGLAREASCFERDPRNMVSDLDIRRRLIAKRGLVLAVGSVVLPLASMYV